VVNQDLLDDLEYWQRRIAPCETSGLMLWPEDCYKLGLILECVHDDLIQLQSLLEIERSALNALDPEGSRRRMELRRLYGASPYEAQPRSERGRSSQADDPKGKPVFRNL